MNTNDFLALNFKDIKDYADLFPQNRREFLKRFSGGIVIFIALSDVLFAQEEARRPRGGRPGLPSDFNAFLRIGEDGRVTCFTGKIEMGQGPVTSLPQMLAEDLETPLDSVDIIMGDTDLCPWDMGTFGSMTTRFFGPALRAAAAEAKAVLLELAADALNFRPAKHGASRYLRAIGEGTKDRATRDCQTLVERPLAIQGDRQTGIAPRQPRQSYGQSPILGRYSITGHALRENPEATGAWRQIEER